MRITNKPSDNFFAEMLLKDLALQASGRGTTAAGGAARRPASPAGSGRARGSWTAPASRAATAPRRWRVVAPTQRHAQPRRVRGAFLDSLRDRRRGRHALDRMRARRGAAALPRQDRHAVERERAVGLLRGPSGDTYAYSILMNGVYPPGARRLQDAMLQAIAAGEAAG